MRSDEYEGEYYEDLPRGGRREGAGRPRLPAEQKMHTWSVRLNTDMIRAIERNAAAAGIRPSTYVRRLLRVLVPR